MDPNPALESEPLLPEKLRGGYVGGDDGGGGGAGAAPVSGQPSAPGPGSGAGSDPALPAACPTGTVSKQYWSCPGNAGFKVRFLP